MRYIDRIINQEIKDINFKMEIHLITPKLRDL